MLHEILMALGGYPGCLFTDSENGTYKIVKDLPFMNPGEIAVLERLCKLVTWHKNIKDFIKAHGRFMNGGIKEITDMSDSIISSNSSGQYMKAVCHGLEVVLEPYHSQLLDLENEILKDPHLPISHIQQALMEYNLLFPALVELIEDINKRSARGCHLLDILHKHVSSGIPSVQVALKKLLHACHCIMYTQLSVWLLYGFLRDPHHEFFIQQKSNTFPVDCKEEIEVDLMPDNIVSTEGINNNEEFILQPDLLPIYIPCNLAEKILFVGQSIRLLECKNQLQKNHLNTPDSLIVLPNKQQFAKDLYSLELEPEFSIYKFEAVINTIRGCVAEQLWKVVVEDVRLINHLHIMKDFYLLGRGELFQAFIDQAGSLLQAPLTSTTEHEVKMAFQIAARSILIEDDSLLEKFHFSFRTKDSVKNQPLLIENLSKTNNGWDNINLKYDVPWPLHILFTGPILEKYNTMFCYLLHIKRVQLELQQSWTLQMQWKNAKERHCNVTAWKLRTVMAFIVDNLQYYLQVDVLESQFSLLVEKIQSTHDFEAIKHAHETFVTNLHAQAFLSSKLISKCILEMLDLCLVFCQIVRIDGALPPRLSPIVTFPSRSSSFPNRLAELEKKFLKQATFLFQILSNGKTYQTSHFVSQLVMRLDFNKFFSGNKLFL